MNFKNWKSIMKVIRSSLSTKKRVLLLVSIVSIVSCNDNQVAVNTRAEDRTKVIYAKAKSFRETPYVDIRPAAITTKDSVQDIKHYKFTYDEKGRLIEFRSQLRDKLVPYYGRFARAPWIKIEYRDSLEIRTFFNEHGHRTLVSGDVYETRIDLDKEGKRKKMTFYNIDGKVIENDFGIATYEWDVISETEIIERRYDIENNIQRNRPGFGYLITKFHYDGSSGLLDYMENLGAEGKAPTPDESGVLRTKVGYDEKGRFTQWLNLAIDNRPLKGMSQIAEIRYEPSKYSREQVATFIDENGNPQMTNWGAHQVVYEFDSHGNEISRKYMGLDGKPTTVSSGVGEVRTTWTNDGMYIVSRTDYDLQGKKVGRGEHNRHGSKTDFDGEGRPIAISTIDIDGAIVMNDYSGYAIESYTYDEQERLVERKFLNTENELVDHNVWKVALFRYTYKNETELSNVESFNTKGESVKAQWNPRH